MIPKVFTVSATRELIVCLYRNSIRQVTSQLNNYPNGQKIDYTYDQFVVARPSTPVLGKLWGNSGWNMRLLLLAARTTDNSQDIYIQSQKYKQTNLLGKSNVLGTPGFVNWKHEVVSKRYFEMQTGHPTRQVGDLR